MKKFLYIIILFFFTCLTTQISAQNISNEGSDFWLTFPTHDPNGSSLANMNVFVTSKNTSEVTVSCGTYSETKTIPANTVVSFVVPRANSYINYAEGNAVLTNRAIHAVVTSGKPNVSVYAHVYASARSAASLILPTEALGQKYYSMNYTQDASGTARNFLTLVAVEDNTKLILHKKSGDDVSITLAKKGDVYEYLPTNTEDLTGTFVEVDPTTSICKKFAAFSGSTSIIIACNGSRDPLFQQLYTTNSWGKSYGVVPFIDRRHILRVLAQEDNTKVFINGSLVTTINKGVFYETSPLTNAAIISADKLISVAQYSLTQGCSGVTGGSKNGDPEMVLLNPTEFNIKNVTLFSANKEAISEKYINVFMKTAKTATFKLNGALPTNGIWKVVTADPTYSYIQIAVTQESLTLTADDGFNAIAYGFGSVESYAYSAGTNLASTQFLLLQNKVTNSETSAACIGQAVDFKMTLPYLLTKVIWKFSDGSSDIVDNNPAYTQAVVNGQTLYTYISPINRSYSTAQKIQVSAIASVSATAGSCFTSDIEFVFSFDVDPLPTASFEVNLEGCEDKAIAFTDKSTANVAGKVINKWLWDFGDGNTSTQQNPSHVYTTNGNMRVKLSVAAESGCYADVFTKDILINPKVVSSFTVNQTTCVNTKISFVDQSTIASGSIVKWIWDMGDGKTALVKTDSSPFLYEYATPGAYTVKLIAESDKGCVSVPFQLVVNVSVLPVNAFVLPENCLSDGPAIFVNTSKNVDGSTNNLSYQWDFGDPVSGSLNSSTTQNGSHKYNLAGTYPVTLTLTNTNGCVVVVKQDFVVKPLPTADFLVNTEGCEDVSVNFTDKSTSNVADRKLVKWLWDFGDGTTSTQQNPSHVYQIFGNITVKLTVETETGCVSTTLTKNILINPKVVARFNVNQNTCVNTKISFVNQSIIASGSIVKWVWDMGDGKPLLEKTNGAPFLYEYDTPGNYTVKLVSYSDKGCFSNPFELTVHVSILPTNDFLLPDVCLSDGPAVFVNSSKDVDGSTNNLTYLWSFGDPASGVLNTSTARNGSHKYNAQGNYTVSLTITNAKGCVVKLEKIFTVNGIFPVAGFDIVNATGLCSNKNISLVNTSTVDFGTVTKIEWYLDGVKHSEDINPSPNKVYDFVYPQFTSPMTKNLTVKMVVYSGGTCSNVITKNLTLLATPVVNFKTTSPICLADGTAFFENLSKDVDGTINNLTYLWGFDDPTSGALNSSTAKDGTHKYSMAGVYNISLTITNANGCTVKLVQAVTVNGAIPIAAFEVQNASSLCSNKDISIKNTSTVAFGDITKIEWYLDGVKYSEDNNPLPNLVYNFTYPQFSAPLSKNVLVKLVAYSAGVCTNETTQSLTVLASPVVKFNALTPVCLNNGTFQMQASETGGLAGVGLYSGPGVTSSGVFNPQLAGVGTHQITYTYTAVTGCVDVVTQVIEVYPIPTIDAGEDLFVLVGGAKKLNASAQGLNVTYKWTPATGLDKDDILNPMASPTDDITYTLMVTSSQGCTVSDDVFVKVLQNIEAPNSFTPNGDGINDLWNVKYLDTYPNSSVEIYNRSGERVFYSNGYAIPFDGNYKNQSLPVGTYYYIINPNNGRKRITGSLTLIR